MNIISLNTWGGRAGKEKLLSFFEAYKHDTDIFCLQEIWSASYDKYEGQKAGGKVISHSEIMIHGLREISALLSDFTPYFRPHYGDHYGLLMMVRKGMEVNVEGEIFVHKYKGYLISDGDVGHHARNVQFITIDFKGSPLTIMNFHGLWNGKGKGDSEDRLLQSEKILEFIQTISGNIVLCGDFNLLPETQSIKILEDTGLRNLIKESGITSTRTSFYTKPEKFADYVFVSKNIDLEEFRVLPEEVSDHAPLLLKIK